MVLPWQNTTSVVRVFLWIHFNMRSMGIGERKAYNRDMDTPLNLVWRYLSLLHFTQGQQRGGSDLQTGIKSRSYWGFASEQ